MDWHLTLYSLRIHARSDPKHPCISFRILGFAINLMPNCSRMCGLTFSLNVSIIYVVGLSWAQVEICIKHMNPS
jgi:hypothetical protein